MAALPLRGCFVTGTDTGAGKTVLAAALCAAMRASGERVAAFKPVVTGLDEPAEGGWPADHELLASVTGTGPQDVCPVTYGPAVSPHLAAQLAGSAGVTVDGCVTASRRAASDARADVLVVEGVGGLLAPLSDDASVRDLALALALPLVIAARPGLGTINHSLLTIEAARAVGLDVRAVVLTPWPALPSVMQRSNRDTIARLGEVEVAALPELTSSAEALAVAGGELPWRGWIGAGG